MDHIDSTAVLWGFSAIQAIGLAAAWLARVSEGSAWQPWCQRLFLVCLLLTGATTMLAPGFGSSYWLTSSATLGVMVVTAVCDFQQQDRAFTI